MIDPKVPNREQHIVAFPVGAAGLERSRLRPLALVFVRR